MLYLCFSQNKEFAKQYLCFSQNKEFAKQYICILKQLEMRIKITEYYLDTSEIRYISKINDKSVNNEFYSFYVKLINGETHYSPDYKDKDRCKSDRNDLIDVIETDIKYCTV